MIFSRWIMFTYSLAGYVLRHDVIFTSLVVQNNKKSKKLFVVFVTASCTPVVPICFRTDTIKHVKHLKLAQVVFLSLLRSDFQWDHDKKSIFHQVEPWPTLLYDMWQWLNSFLSPLLDTALSNVQLPIGISHRPHTTAACAFSVAT